MFLIHRMRAAVTLGFAWSVPWAAAGAAFITWRVFLGSPRLAFPLQYWPRFALHSALVLGAFGFVAGITFAITLGKTARGRTLNELSLAYAARWGIIAGAVSMVAAPLMGIVAWPLLFVAGGVFAVIGAGTAMATLGLARRPTSYRALASEFSERQPNER